MLVIFHTVLAQKCLGISATSTTSERFSVVGIVVNKICCDLTAEMINALVFLRT